MIAAGRRLVTCCLAAVTSGACADPTAPDVVPVTWSFVTGMDDWLVEGLDLDDPPVAWGIGRSDDRATDGRWSARS